MLEETQEISSSVSAEELLPIVRLWRQVESSEVEQELINKYKSNKYANTKKNTKFRRNKI